MLSVIVPVYNAEKYLKRTFRSICHQTFRDYEVILVDDGSSDGSAAICDAIAEEDRRFFCIHKENGGVSSARNMGLAHSRGGYITFLDADDEIPENYFEVLYQALAQSQGQMSVCDVKILQDGSEIRRFTCEPGTLSQQEALNYLLSRKKINSGPCAKMFSREVLRELEFKPLKVYEDILFVMEAVSRCTVIAVTDRTAYRYYQNGDSAMSNVKKLPAEDIIRATEQILVFIRGRKDLAPECTYASLSHLMQYVQPLLKKDSPAEKSFVRAARRLTRKYVPEILGCSAFPWKEKILYTAFSVGVDL